MESNLSHFITNLLSLISKENLKQVRSSWYLCVYVPVRAYVLSHVHLPERVGVFAHACEPNSVCCCVAAE